MSWFIIFAYRADDGQAAVAQLASANEGPYVAGELRAPTFAEALAQYGELFGDDMGALMPPRP